MTQLVREVEEGRHAERFKVLGSEPLDDKLQRIELPYMTPGSQLEAALRGEAAIDGATAGAVERLLSSSCPAATPSRDC